MSDDGKLTGEEKFKSQFEKYLDNNPNVAPGQTVKGAVIRINDDGSYLVFVSGIKREIRVSSSEAGGDLKIGDEVEGVLKEDSKGRYQIVKRFVQDDAQIDEYKRIEAAKEPVLGEIISLVTKKVSKDGKEEVIPCGYDVRLDGSYIGFCPLSKVDVEKVAKPETLIGKKDYFIIEKFSPNHRVKSILNRRELLQAQIDASKKEFFDTVGIGDVVEGTVKNLTTFGAFVDLGGFDGLLHINDMSWGHVSKAKDFVKKGETLRLRVISIDKENSKINLSLKDMSENPWSTFAQRYSVGQVIKGKVMRCTTFGVFIEIEPSIEGLAHISELSWTKKNFNPADIFHHGDVVEAKILGYDIENERVSLGIKELVENPWNKLAEKFTVGTKLTAKAVKVTQLGAFFQLDGDIDGFLSASDMSWTDKIKDMRGVIKEGDEKEVVVVSVDTAKQKIRLSIKALSDNPWQLFKDSYPKGSKVNGEITEVSDKGVQVKVNEDVVGFISKFNLALSEGENVDDKYKVGDSISAIVTNIDMKSKKLMLSVKALEAKEELGDYEKYLSSDNDDSSESGFTLADILSKGDN